MMTPNMLIMHDVNTPSHVPNNTGSEMKKLAFHHGLLSDDCKTQQGLQVPPPCCHLEGDFKHT